MNRWAIWFRWTVVLGILVNLFFALPGSFVPNAVLGLVDIDPVSEPIWPAFASWLLLLLSMFYIPGAVNPFRYRVIAWLSIAARFAGVLFFFVIWKQYPLFGIIDLVFGSLQLLFLRLANSAGPGIEDFA